MTRSATSSDLNEEAGLYPLLRLEPSAELGFRLADVLRERVSTDLAPKLGLVLDQADAAAPDGRKSRGAQPCRHCQGDSDVDYGSYGTRRLRVSAQP